MLFYFDYISGQNVTKFNFNITFYTLNKMTFIEIGYFLLPLNKYYSVRVYSLFLALEFVNTEEFQ